MSYSVIIADDEPLVLIGLQDMVNWQEEGFEIVAQARNGKELSEKIETLKPDLVLTDIKMPVKSGIEVLEEERNRNKRLPLFIFLTSFEEFELAKKAISLGAVDYIVKLELEKEQLTEAIRKAKSRIAEIKGRDSESSEISGKRVLQEHFFIRQLFNIDTGESEPAEIGLNLSYPAFTVAYITIPDILEEKNSDRSVSLSYSASRLIDETVNRYTECFVIQLDSGHLAAIFPFSEKAKSGYRSYVYSAFKTALESLRNYFSLDSHVAVGPLVNHPSLLSDSFFKAKLLAARGDDGNEKIVFFDHSQNRNVKAEGIVIDSKGISRAFSELSPTLLRECMQKLILSMRNESTSRVYAIDAASSVLYMAMNSLPDASSVLEEIFPSSENMFSYRAIYQARNTDEVIAWIEKFTDGLEKLFRERNQDYRLKTVQRIQAYINENITGNLDLGSVSSVFGYSRNYLSSLFTKYASTSFVDYVNSARMERAKKMLADPNALVYEVATALGYDSPFYFSKVFKKITGMSPTAYQNRIREKSE